MGSLSISLLGGFQVEWNGQPVTAFESNKVRALLVYLAVEATKPHQRTDLAALLWPDHPTSMARTNLRHVLRQLRQSLPDVADAPPLLLVTQQTIQLNPDVPATVDAVRFDQLLMESQRCTHREFYSCSACIQRYAEAASLYRGDFLGGLTFQDCDLFEEWIIVRREGYHSQIFDVCAALAAFYEKEGDLHGARRYAHRQLELEPWRESAHCQLMRILARGGQRTAALAQFAQCQQILLDEFDAEPTQETVRLYQEIRADRLTQETSQKELLSARSDATTPTASPPVQPVPRQEWGDAPATSHFYGRESDVERLQQWLLDVRCRLVVVLGMGGMGKTTLVAKVARAVELRFDSLFWRSLVNAPPLSEFLQEWLQFLSRQQLPRLSHTLNEQLTTLEEYLRQQRCLLVLDNVESIMEAGQAGQYRTGYEGYGQLIERLAQGQHQSCLVLTSRERPHRMLQLEEDFPSVHSLQMEGLSAEAGQALLKSRGIDGGANLVANVVRRYSGNPLALKLVARTIQELFEGDTAAFLSDELPIFDDIRTVLDQQFARLTSLEREVLIALAVERVALPVHELMENVQSARSMRTLLEALRALQRRSLLEKSDSGFALQNVVTEYVTEYIVEQACAEIQQGRLGLLNRHPLLKTQAKEYIRQSQSRLILQPVMHKLTSSMGRTALEKQFKGLLAHMRREAPLEPGYAGGNLLNLLLQPEPTLQGYDFSRLSIWQAYLRGKRLLNIDFTDAAFRHTAFTDAFGLVGAVAVSPPVGAAQNRSGEGGEALLAAGTSTGEIYLWQMNSGHSHAIFKGDPKFVWSVAFSRDGTILAGGGEGERIWLWNVQRQALHQILVGHTGTVRAVLFSPDGHMLFSASDDQTVRQWDVATGQLCRTFEGHTNKVWGLAISPDGRTVASCGDDQRICMWDVETGQLHRSLEEDRDGIRVVAFSPDAQLLASGGDDQKIRLWEVSSGKLRHVLEGHTNLILSLAFSPVQNVLVSGSADQTVRLWDAESGQGHRTLYGHTSYVWDVAFSSDGKMVVSGGGDQSVCVWDAPSGLLLSTLRGHSKRHNAVAFHPTGDRMASGGADQLVRIWGIASNKPQHILPGHSNWLWSVAFSPDGHLLASSSADRTIRLWEVSTGRLRHILQGHTAQVRGIVFSPDGSTLASGSDDQTIRLWDVATGQPQRVLHGHESWVWGVAFLPDGETLVSSSGDQTVRLWERRRGALHTTLRGHSNRVWGIAVSPDGKLLASGSDDQTVCLWSAQSGKLRHRLEGHDSVVWSVAFSSDGQLLASGSGDRSVRLWNAQNGAALTTLHGHTNWVLSVAFHPRGNLLASASADETIRLWDVETATCLQTLHADGPYAGMKIRGATGVSDVRRTSLKALGAVEE